MNQFQSIRGASSLGRDIFTAGDRSDKFEDIKHLHPRFAYDFISLGGSEFCFNSSDLGLRDYQKLMKSFKELSLQTYEVMNREHRYHFHDIDWNDVTVSKSDFMKCIYKGVKRDAYDDEDITAYQFKVYEEARIVGFIYKGIFYLVMFDRGHNAYKRKDKKKK